MKQSLAKTIKYFLLICTFVIGMSFTSFALQTDMEVATDEYEEETQEELRQDLIDYALSFVGGNYRWGGTDPHNGADCSGFTSYVMSQIAGIGLSHSSRAQANEGAQVGYEDLQVGDLVFYASGRIDHVAIYIGNDQVVHAANERKGIIVSNLYHRKPVKFVNVIG